MTEGGVTDRQQLQASSEFFFSIVYLKRYVAEIHFGNAGQMQSFNPYLIKLFFIRRLTKGEGVASHYITVTPIQNQWNTPPVKILSSESTISDKCNKIDTNKVAKSQ